VTETPRVRTLVLDVPEWAGHRAGQHVDVRLTAEDGYQAERSYSLASAPGEPPSITIERLDDGEVSPYLVDEVVAGDKFELRGPIGGWFTWAGDVPIVCVGGGTGVVPFVSMLRHARRIGAERLIKVCAVGRSRAALPYADELLAAGAFVALTRENLDGRVAAPPYLDELEPLVAGAERAYVCGSVGFASYATRLLGEAAVRTDAIRVEQFGASG